jgi:pimeloyl-ACP methyl ester carboxylesterase
VDARARALTTFDPLLTRLHNGSAKAHPFREADLRIFSFDPADAASYDPASTRVALAASVAALQREYVAWRHHEPHATFDIAGYSLGGMIALAWAAQASEDDLAHVHAIVTLDSPVAGYPQTLAGYVRSYLSPLFGAVAPELIGDSALVRSIARAPAHWSHGAGQASNAVYCIGNLRDLIVPAFTSTLATADGVLDDLGTGPDAFNHGAVLRTARALDYASAVLQAQGGPQLRG